MWEWPSHTPLRGNVSYSFFIAILSEMHKEKMCVSAQYSYKTVA